MRCAGRARACVITQKGTRTMIQAPTDTSLAARLLHLADAAHRTKLWLTVWGKDGNTFSTPRASTVHLGGSWAGSGVPDIERYVWSLSRNRVYLARKRTHALQRMTVLLRLAVTVASFTLRRRNLKVISAAWRGLLDAFRLPLPQVGHIKPL